MRNKSRSTGVLTKLSGNTFPKELVFFDTETREDIHENGKIDFPFRLGYAIYLKLDTSGRISKRKDRQAYSQEELFSFIIEPTKTARDIHVFAHNVPFDLRTIYFILRAEKAGFESEPPIVNQMVFIWTLRKGKKKITIYDTANFGVRSVEQLGKDMGYEKGEVDFNTVNDFELMRYCIRDVEILERFMYEYISFIIENRLGSFKQTLASQSLTALRSRFMYEDMYIHNHIGAIKLEREGYTGGRTEAFKLGYIGQQNYYLDDVNSMYPFVMSEMELPNMLIGYSEHFGLNDLKALHARYYVIADVSIDTQTNAYPLKVLPEKKAYAPLKKKTRQEYKNLTDFQLIYPIGKFRTILHHEELRLALKEKSVRKLHRVAWYSKGSPFKDYVKFFYDAKNKYGSEGNKTWRMIAKLFLNSLYGKFGQLQAHRESLYLELNYNFGRFPFHNDKNGFHGQVVVWNGQTYLEYKEGETPFSNAALAGAVTSNARMVLYDFIRIAGKGNVFYCDTDSLILNQKGHENLSSYIDAEKMGYLDTEYEANRLIIRAPKDYRLGKNKRHKGLSKLAVKIGSNLWSIKKFEGFISFLNNSAVDGMHGRIVTKSRVSGYNKGMIDDENNITPFVLKEF